MNYVISAPDFVISGADFVISAPDFVISGIALDSMSDFICSFVVPFERGTGLSGICPKPMAKGSVCASCTCVERGTATIVMGSPFSFFYFHL